MLYVWTKPALFGYFIARQSALFSDDLDIEGELVAGIEDAVFRHRQALQDAATAFEVDGDLDRRHQVALVAAGDLLERLAWLLGHRHGREQAGLQADGVVASILEPLELLKWFGLLEVDLDSLWRHRGAWPSFEAFSAFTAHLERLLWQLGVMSWRIDEDQHWIQFFPTDGLNAAMPTPASAPEPRT